MTVRGRVRSKNGFGQRPLDLKPSPSPQVWAAIRRNGPARLETLEEREEREESLPQALRKAKVLTLDEYDQTCGEDCFERDLTLRATGPGGNGDPGLNTRLAAGMKLMHASEEEE